MQAMIRLYQKYLPDFYIDCHVTDGADYIYPLTYDLQMHGNLSKQQSAWLQDSYLPFVENEIFEPLPVDISILTALLTAAAIFFVIFESCFQSIFIGPSSIETSKSGMLAYLALQTLVKRSLNRV